MKKEFQKVFFILVSITFIASCGSGEKVGSSLKNRPSYVPVKITVDNHPNDIFYLGKHKQFGEH